MSDVAEVHLTLGNHDLNLVNLSRQDAISPIVDALGNPRIHLYKNSGVYQIQNGYNLCVYSLFDEQNWPSVVPIPGDINIACYHGPVWGSKTESDWAVEDGIRTDFFDAYEFTLLGDIHKRQDLRFRDNKPIMSYPGSLIQQNYAEELDHGYLLWNIENSTEWSVSFRKLPNLKPYITLPWDDNVDTLLESAKKYPQGTRYRIKSQIAVPQDKAHLVSESLKTIMAATEVIYKSEFQIDTQKVTTGNSKLIKSDLRSPDILIKLMKEYHPEDKLTTDDTEIIKNQVKSYISTVSSGEEVSRGSKWTIRQVKWDNMFIYGPGNSINFDKLNGIVGIFGPNRVGKSSIVGTLMYSLFNTTDRGSMKNLYVCNIRKPYCMSTAIIAHNGTTYAIERQTTKEVNKKGIVTAATALNLFRMKDDGEMEDLCGEQRTDTEKTIRNLIGTSDDFLMTSLSAQGEANQFLSQGSTKRRSILSKFLDLDIFDKMYDLANKDINGFKAQLKNFPDRNWEELSKLSSESLNELEILIEKYTQDISDAQTKITLLRSEMSQHNRKPVSQSDIDAQTLSSESLLKRSTECLEKIQSKESEISELSIKLTSLNSMIESIDIVELKKRHAAQQSLEKSIVDLRHFADKESTVLLQQRKSLKILDEVPCGDNYPTCKFIKDAHALKDKVTDQEKIATSAAMTLHDAEKSFNVIKDSGVEEKIIKHAKVNELILKIQLEISNKETELVRLKSTSDTLTLALTEANDKLKILSDAICNDENEEVTRIRSQLDSLSKSVKLWDAEKMSCVDNRGKSKSRIEVLNNEKSSRDSLLEKLRIQELITTAFSKKGIPLLIAKTQLPMINAEVSKILQGIVDFTIELENDEESDALEVYINYGDSRRIIELCSGMEKTITSIALRVAMINVTTLPKPDIFILDEGFGTLDGSGVEACNRLLLSLKRYFRTIVVITHIDGIKDVADHVIEISKKEKDSFVEHF